MEYLISIVNNIRAQAAVNVPPLEMQKRTQAYAEIKKKVLAS
jgi:hypothetical protein